ncbi:MAG TPA: Fe-S cluster assembly protein SufD [Maritimibacter sp.]|nr:Fe-S cluster assembly protein SufD [Maritimibacter sp.]
MAALTQKKQDALSARLGGMTMPEGGAWITEARNDAVARLEAMGLPGPRDEYWRFTKPDTLNAAQAPEAAVLDHGSETPVFSAVDRIKIVFVDGVFQPDESSDLSNSGVEIERLADVARADIHWAKDIYGKIETLGQTPVERPHAVLNTAYATDGVVIRVAGKVEKPISLYYRHESATSDAYLHHVVKLEEGAEMTLLENGPAAARFNKVMEVDVGDKARFHHIRAQGRDHERRAYTAMFVRQGAESLFKSFTLTANGRLTRNEAYIELAGPDASAHIAGAALGHGDFHHDDTVFIKHDAENCESRQVFKKVLRKGAVGTFQGKILVERRAQKTDGYQKSQSLLLDDDAVFLAKPELEIYADDVACSHGSTSGAIDEDMLFYLRARGVDKDTAMDLLVLAFVAEAIMEIEDEGYAEEISERLESWLLRRRQD